MSQKVVGVLMPCPKDRGCPLEELWSFAEETLKDFGFKADKSAPVDCTDMFIFIEENPFYRRMEKIVNTLRDKGVETNSIFVFAGRVEEAKIAELEKHPLVVRVMEDPSDVS